MAPNAKPTGQARPNSQWVAAATAMVVNATQPTASSEIGTEIESELTPTHRHRGRVYDGWQHQEQNQLWGQLQRRQARHERQGDAGKHQQNGWRNLDSCCDDRNRRNYDQQQYQYLDSRNHERPSRQYEPWGLCVGTRAGAQ